MSSIARAHADRADAGRVRTGRLPTWTLVTLATLPAVFIAVFYIWPVATLVGRAASTGAVRDIVHDAALRHVVWFTLWQATASTVVTVVIGLVPAWVLARYEFRGRRFFTALVTVPFVLPTVVVGAAFLAILPVSLDQSVVAILLAHVFFNIAVVVRGVGGLWEQLPPDLTSAARTLGASPLQAMREVTLPLLAPAIAASASVVFLFTFTSFGVVRILGGPAHTTLEVEIWQRATRFGDIGVAAVLSIAQLVILGLAVLWFARVQARRRNELGLQPLDARRPARRRGERVAVVATTATIALIVGTPLGALVERSTRTTTGHSLAAWRAVFTPSSQAVATIGGNRVDALGALTTSIRFAIVAMVISIVIGGAAAFAIAALGRMGRLLDVGVMLPLGTSAVTIGFGMLITFDVAPVDWRAEPWLIPLGHALVATPFVVRLLLPTLRSIDDQLRGAAATLGASPLRVWREIDVRLSLGPLRTAAGFALAISLGEFGATSFLTRQGRTTLPIAIEQLLNRPGPVFHAEGYVLASVLALLTLVVIGSVEGLRLREGHRARRS